MRRGIVLLLALTLLGVPTATAGPKKKKNADTENIGQRDINKGSWNLYSPEREMALGAELARQAERSSHLVKDPVVLAYVTEVAERIASHSDLRMPLQVRVIDSDEVNAFALPGGHFFVNTGLLLEAQSEAELAGVIAHEVAHVAARHATKQMTKAQIWNLVSIPLLVVGGPVAYGVEQGLTLAIPLTFMKFSRNAEREADFLGQQYHSASGYDPAAFVDFFERMKGMEKSPKAGIARAFSTHPMTKDRIEAAERTIEQVLTPREEYVVTTSRHDVIRAYLRNLQGQHRLETESGGPVLRKRNTPDGPPESDPQKETEKRKKGLLF
jgi:predicted Zn-dependent protease